MGVYSLQMSLQKRKLGRKGSNWAESSLNCSLQVLALLPQGSRTWMEEEAGVLIYIPVHGWQRKSNALGHLLPFCYKESFPKDVLRWGSIIRLMLHTTVVSCVVLALRVVEKLYFLYVSVLQSIESKYTFLWELTSLCQYLWFSDFFGREQWHCNI